MRTTPFGRALLLGMALACTLTALGLGGWLVFHPARACDELDAETCLELISADAVFAESLQLVALGLAIAGPVLGLLWRDATRRAREAAP